MKVAEGQGQNGSPAEVRRPMWRTVHGRTQGRQGVPSRPSVANHWPIDAVWQNCLLWSQLNSAWHPGSSCTSVIHPPGVLQVTVHYS